MKMKWIKESMLRQYKKAPWYVYLLQSFLNKSQVTKSYSSDDGRTGHSQSAILVYWKDKEYFLKFGTLERNMHFNA